MRARFINEVKEESEFSPKQKNAIKKFVLNYKGDFKDEEIHSFSEKIGLDKHEVEEYIYSLARQGLKSVNEENTIKGGKGDKTTEKDVCPKQLAVGKKVEMEHTSSKEKATEIALDHLSENPQYYSKLVKDGLVDEGPAIEEFIKQFGKKELPKKLQEGQEFERGVDPKKSLNLGLDCEKYVKMKLAKTPYNTQDDLEGFWDLYYAGFEDMSEGDMGEHVIHILNESFKNPQYMTEYMDSEIENYIDFRQETDDDEDEDES